MKKYKNLQCVLLCVGLLAALTGCGKNTEENSSAGMPLGTSSAFEAEAETEPNTGAEQETKSTKKSDKKSDQQSETEDTSATSAAETDSSETSTDTSEQTSGSVTEVHSTDTDSETVTLDNQDQNAETPHEDSSQQDPVASDTSHEVTDAPPEVTQDSAPDVTEPEITEPPAEDPNALTVTYQGHVITIGGDVTKFTNAVKPNFEQSAPSCMRDGDDIAYYYDDLTINVWGNEGKFLVCGVDIMSPGIAPVQGYDIDSTADFVGEKFIDCGNGYTIVLTEAGGQVINISYNKDF
ncbi:MAG: hypothetical protein K2H89_03705 [Oscillospiraceae bacterium]|nr:hypothetical protein [Oscillospiraceae bacterium]